MFNSRMQYHQVAKPIYKDDGYGFDVPEYKKIGKKLIHLVTQDRSLYQMNDFKVIEATVVGYTQDSTIQEGYLIDNIFKVVKVIPHRREYVLYLEAANDGF